MAGCVLKAATLVCAVKIVGSDSVAISRAERALIHNDLRARRWPPTIFAAQGNPLQANRLLVPGALPHRSGARVSASGHVGGRGAKSLQVAGSAIFRAQGVGWTLAEGLC